MTSLPDIALWIAAVLGSSVVLILGYVVVRRLISAVLAEWIERRVKRVQEVLRQHQEQQFNSLDRLLFQLGELNDLPAVETALNDLLRQRVASEGKPQLLKIYSSLGLVQHYISQLREGTKWSDRAAAAHVLGELGVAEAIPQLVAAMSDPHEDARTVKLAAAKALGQISPEEAVPLLVRELALVDEWASPRISEVLVGYGKAAIPALLAALTSKESTNSRIWAAQILGRIGVAAAENQLIALLRDRYEQVRISAAEALGRLKSKQALNELIRVAMKDPVAPVRAEAARALGAIGDEAALQSLVLLLSDPDYWSRMRAIEAIELIAPEDPSFLEASLRDLSPEIRRRAAVTLERIGVLQRSIEDLSSPKAAVWNHAQQRLIEMARAGLVESLLGYLEHPDLKVRARVTTIVGQAGDPRAVSSLAPLIHDQAWPVRAKAIEAIANLAPPGAMSLVLPALSDPEETVRAAAIAAVKQIGDLTDEAAADSVVQLFDNPNAEIRISTVEAVSQLQHPSVKEMLRRALSDPNPAVRLWAARAAGSRAEPDWLPALVELLGDVDAEVRVAAAEGLEGLGNEEALVALSACATTPNRELRESITAALARRGLDAVKRYLGQPESNEATLALIWALGKAGDARAIDDLASLLQRTDPNLRAAVAGALGKIPEPRAVELLLGSLTDRSERVRAAVINALGAVGSRAVIPQLLLGFKDPDAFVRNRIALALGLIGGDQGLAALDLVSIRPAEPAFAAYLAAGYGLCGGPSGFKKAITALADPKIQRELDALLRHESAEVQQLLRANLHLPQDKAGGEFDAAQLRAGFAETLRTHQDPGARRAAIEALCTLGSENYRDLLLDAVATDPSPEVRSLALNALSQELQGVEQTFLRALKDPAPEVRRAAAEGLGKTGDQHHNRALIACFLAGEPELDGALVAALSYNNRDKVVPFLDELMGHSESQVLCGGAKVLEQLGDQRSTRLLGVWLSTRDPELRIAAARALGAVGTIDAKQALLGCLTDTNEQVRLVVVEALGRLPGADTLEALSAMCRDPSVTVRLTLAQVVAASRLVGAAELGESLSRDPEEEVRVAALLALLSRKDADGVQRFLRLYPDQPTEVHRRLRATDPTGALISGLYKMGRADPLASARVAAIKTLPLLGQRPLELLLDAFSDPAPAVRIAAIEAAAPLKDQELISEALDRLLRDADKEVQDTVRRIKLAVIGKSS